MSTRRLAVLVAFADAARGAALAEALGDDNSVIVVHPSELEEPGAADVIVSDGAMLDPEGPPQVVVGAPSPAPPHAAARPYRPMPAVADCRGGAPRCRRLPAGAARRVGGHAPAADGPGRALPALTPANGALARSPKARPTN